MSRAGLVTVIRVRHREVITNLVTTSPQWQSKLRLRWEVGLWVRWNSIKLGTGTLLILKQLLCWVWGACGLWPPVRLPIISHVTPASFAVFCSSLIQSCTAMLYQSWLCAQAVKPLERQGKACRSCWCVQSPVAIQVNYSPIFFPPRNTTSSFILLHHAGPFPNFSLDKLFVKLSCIWGNTDSCWMLLWSRRQDLVSRRSFLVTLGPLSVPLQLWQMNFNTWMMWGTSASQNVSREARSAHQSHTIKLWKLFLIFSMLMFLWRISIKSNLHWSAAEFSVCCFFRTHQLRLCGTYVNALFNI